MKKDRLELAIELACIFHAGQLDKQGKPYIIHPMYVMGQFSNIHCQIVAALHDVFEDTSAHFDIIKDIFSNSIYDALVAITRKKDEKYFDYIERLSHDSIAIQVKIEDLKHNISKCIGKDEYQSLLKRYEKALQILQEKLKSY